MTASSSQAYGGSYRFRATGAYADPATWAGQLPASGQYSVSATWISGANRSSAAPYIISHASVSTTVMVNQQVNGGKWNLLGSFNFSAGINTIKLSPWTTDGSVVVADAVKWQ